MAVYSYRKKDGKYYYCKFRFNNKQIIKRGFTCKKEALLFEANALNSSQFKRKKEVACCSELESSFIKFLYTKYKESSAYRYAGTFKLYLAPFFKNYKVTTINNYIIEMLNNNINKLNYKDKKNIIFLAKVYINFLSKYGLDPAVNINNLYIFKQDFVEPKRFDYYTLEEFTKFSSVINDVKFKLLFEMLFCYGLRIGELRGIKVSDIDFKNNKIFIRRAISNKTGSKGQKVTSVKTSNSIRDYPILPKVKILLIEYLKIAPTKTFLFCSNKNKSKAIGESTIKRAELYYCERSGIRPIKLHEFRHSCATYLFNKGADINLVASWLGHSDSSTTMRVYAHLLPSRKLELMKYFNDS